MIYSIIILISSLLLFPVQSADNSFYIINAGVIEQCSTGSITYLSKFDSNKMRCLDKTWRHVSINVEYLCEKNLLKRNWTMKTNVNQNSEWPKKVHILVVNSKTTDYTLFDITANRLNEIIEETPRAFDSNNNQLIAYIWTTARGAQCRIKYTILKDVCTTNKGKIFGAKLTEFVCYYGKQDFSLVNTKERDTFNKLLDDHIKPSTNTASNNPSNNNNSQNNTTPSALTANESTFWQKNKAYILIAAGIGGFILLAVVITIIYRQRSSNKDMGTRMSVDSNLE